MSKSKNFYLHGCAHMKSHNFWLTKLSLCFFQLSSMPCRHVGEWRYRSTILNLSTRGERSTSHTGWLTKRERVTGTLGQEARWAPRWVWMLARRENYLAPGRNQTLISWLYILYPSCYDWAIPTPHNSGKHFNIPNSALRFIPVLLWD
jgi:hypothetical protein